MTNNDEKSKIILDYGNIPEMIKQYESSIRRHLGVLPTLKEHKFSLVFEQNYEQIRQCIALGLHGCAIPSLGALVEQLLDEAIIKRKEQRNSCLLTDEEKEVIYKKGLSKTIDLAAEEEVIDSQLAGDLKNFAGKVRNLYSHGAYLEIVKDADLPEELKKFDDYVVDALKKWGRDVVWSVKYFNWLDTIIFRISTRLDELQTGGGKD